MEDIYIILKKFGKGRRNINDIFFHDGNEEYKLFDRQGVKCMEEELPVNSLAESIECTEPGCNARFDFLHTFQMHYDTMHRFICKECKKRLSSPHLLDLHLSEEHDSFFAVQAEKKPMYRCYVESCDKLFLNSTDRSTHAIDVHKFPSDFRFKTNKKKNKKYLKRRLVDSQESMES